MTDDSLFRELCNPSVLRTGWHLALGDSRDDFVRDPVGYADVGASLAGRLGYWVREVANDRYRPRFLAAVDVPKSGLSVRPGSVLPIEEAALLHAIAFLLAPRLDRHLGKEVYSYRLAKGWEKKVRQGKSMFHEGDAEIPFLRGVTLRKIDPMEPWYLAWPEFDRQRLSLVREKGYSHLTRTDISAYFENVDLALLEQLLRKLLPREPKIIGLLMSIMASWTRRTSAGTPIARGIPQGNDVSSFLGNLYLLPLDAALRRFCRQKDAVWLRYVDDVEVYSKSEATAREVVLVVNNALRALWLNLQGSKTEILSGKRLEGQLADARNRAVDAAIEAIGQLDRATPEGKGKLKTVVRNVMPIVAPFRKRLPGSVQQLNKRDGQVLRRVFTIFSTLERSSIKRLAYAILEEPPELRMLQKALRYLERIDRRHHDEAVQRLLGMMEGDLPLLPFHVAAMLECIARLHPSKACLKIAGRVTAIASRRRYDWHVRQKALELLAVLPIREATAAKRAANGLEHHHPFVRRAAMVMLSRAHVEHFRREVELRVGDPDPAVSLMAIWWHRMMFHKATAEQEVVKLGRSDPTISTFSWDLTRLWVLRASPEPDIVIKVRSLLGAYDNIDSAKVQWHLRALRRRTAWAAK